MAPHLVKWQDQFGKDGLLVVDIDDGSTDSFESVHNWLEGEKAPYAIYYDDKGEMRRRYMVNAFPCYYLVGRDGLVVWEDHGWGGDEGVARMENELVRALSAQ